MYILLIAIVASWLFSLFAFAKWRYYSCLRKGVVLETVLHDRITQLYLRFTTGLVLVLIVYTMTM